MLAVQRRRRRAGDVLLCDRVWQRSQMKWQLNSARPVSSFFLCIVLFLYKTREAAAAAARPAQARPSTCKYNEVESKNTRESSQLKQQHTWDYVLCITAALQLSARTTSHIYIYILFDRLQNIAHELQHWYNFRAIAVFCAGGSCRAKQPDISRRDHHTVWTLKFTPNMAWKHVTVKTGIDHIKRLKCFQLCGKLLVDEVKPCTTTCTVQNAHSITKRRHSYIYIYKTVIDAYMCTSYL